MCQKGEINGLSIIVNHQLYSEKKKSERVENVELIISFFISRIYPYKKYERRAI